MALTRGGSRLILEILAAHTDDAIAGGMIRVHGATGSAEAPIETVAVAADGSLVATATFGEQEAVFDWVAQELLSAQGVVIDRTEGDAGRKPFGAVWVVRSTIELPSGI